MARGKVGNVKNIYTYEESHKEINNKLYKLCTLHEKFFPEEKFWIPCTEEYFYKNKSNKVDGLNTYCKRCSRLKANKYRESHNEEHIERCKKWHEENKEKGLSQANRWNEENREHVRERFKVYIKTAQGKEIMRKNSINRYHTKKHKISTKQWKTCKEYFNNSCAYCGMTEQEHKKRCNQQLHKEHVNHEGNNTIENCVPSCRECNSKKHTKTLSSWYNENNLIFSKERLDKIIKWTNEDYKKSI